MKLQEKHHERLKKALRTAYREREKTEIGDVWQTRTMRCIRGLGFQDTNAGYLMSFEKLVWRLTPVACVLIIIFLACLLNIDFVQEYEMVKLFVDDPIEYVFVQSMGI